MTEMNELGTPFTLTGAEDERIRGNMHFPADDPGGALPLVLILHGFKGYKDYGFFPHLTQRLADARFVAVRFNFSHSGIDDDPSTFGRPDLFERDSWSNQLADVRAVIAAAGTLPHADRMDLSRLAVLGHSRGGVVAPPTGGWDQRIKVVVSLSSPSSADMPETQKRIIRRQGYIISPSSRTGQELKVGRAWLEDLEQNAAKLDLTAAVARIGVPLMIVHGFADESVPVACAEAIAADYAGEAEMLILDGAGHTFNCVNPFAGSSPALEELITAVSDFLSTHLPAG